MRVLRSAPSKRIAQKSGEERQEILRKSIGEAGEPSTCNKGASPGPGFFLAAGSIFETLVGLEAQDWRWKEMAAAKALW